MRKLSLIIAGLLLFLTGCAHTNELAKYDLSNMRVIYQEDVLPQAQTINVFFHDPVSGVNNSKQKEDKKENTVLNVLTDIGTGILSGDKVGKLQEAVKTDHLIYNVTDGMRETMETFMNVVPVEQISENPAYIIKSVLQTCELYVTEQKISLQLQAESTIYDRSSGAVVWSNIESETIPVTASNLANDINANKNESKIITAVQFAALSNEKVDQIVGMAAQRVGRNMAEQLRKDFAESKMKK